MTWIGRKKLALLPLFRPNAHPPDQIPADWETQILRRVLFAGRAAEALRDCSQ